jgi:hypothetical protein
MDDRELLELAAKAAGIKHPGGEHCINGPAVWDCEALRWWRPLTDDGDALRLAVRLGFTVEPGRCWHSHYGPAFGEDVLDGELKSTRRAIVRAAAEIGRAM